MIRQIFVFIFITIISITCYSQDSVDSLFEDVQFKPQGKTDFFSSEKVDFLRIQSTISDSVRVAIVVYKPEKPAPILLLSHGWHQSVKPPNENSENPYEGFLTIQVDMRGRQYSTGDQDCNGYELYDFYDAYQYVLTHYAELVEDPSQVYFSGGSGGGGNGYAIVGKFPDLFCGAMIACGMSDYTRWYKQDEMGEFRDEMLPWIGCTPEQCPEAYQSRSGITSVSNILTPLFVVHGETDIRVPVSHAREFVQKAREEGKEIHYLELKGVGTRSHWGNITDEQVAKKDSLTSLALKRKDPPILPEKGRLTIPGYLVTKRFSVFLHSIDEVGEIKYHLKNKKVKFLRGEGKVVWN